MKHALGVLGVLAAGVLLAVSAAVNWRFGYSLGKTELDGVLLGAASAAADCFKALVPFFFFAALKNRAWSQAAASAVVWVVVTCYSFASAIGHNSDTRDATSAHAAQAAAHYKDVRADLERARSQLGWIPQHRPEAAVKGELDGMKASRVWSWSNGCTDTKSKTNREFCDKYVQLTAEAAYAQQAAALEGKIADYQAKLASHTGSSAVTSSADSQVVVIERLTGLPRETIQMGLTILVAMLLEIGSGFGMYVSFSVWRIHDRKAPVAPSMAALQTVIPAAPVTLQAQPQAALPAKVQRSSANDNRTAQPQRLTAPETDVERYHKERIDAQEGASITATALYEDYCAWCEEQQKEPLALPTFGREFGDKGVTKAKIAGRVRYIGIALKSGLELEEDKKLPALSSQAA